MAKSNMIITFWNKIHIMSSMVFFMFIAHFEMITLLLYHYFWITYYNLECLSLHIYLHTQHICIYWLYHYQHWRCGCKKPNDSWMEINGIFTHSIHCLGLNLANQIQLYLLIRWKEGNVLFNDALNTFYLQSNGLGKTHPHCYTKMEARKCFI